MLYHRTGTRLVEDIYSFVREKPVGDISCGKLYGIWDKVRGDVNAVVLFIFVYKTAEDTAGLAIIAMGKLGGEELNYHSDLDIIFVYDYQGYTNGDKQISNQTLSP